MPALWGEDVVSASCLHDLVRLVEGDKLPVRLLQDPVLHAHGHPVDSLYAELAWLPEVGPTALWAARRIALRLSPNGFALNLPLLGAELGVAKSAAAHAPVARALARLVDFGLARLDPDALRASPLVPPLPARFARRLPPHLAAWLHEADSERYVREERSA